MTPFKISKDLSIGGSWTIRFGWAEKVHVPDLFDKDFFAIEAETFREDDNLIVAILNDLCGEHCYRPDFLSSPGLRIVRYFGGTSFVSQTPFSER